MFLKVGKSQEFDSMNLMKIPDSSNDYSPHFNTNIEFDSIDEGLPSSRLARAIQRVGGDVALNRVQKRLPKAMRMIEYLKKKMQSQYSDNKLTDVLE